MEEKNLRIGKTLLIISPLRSAVMMVRHPSDVLIAFEYELKIHVLIQIHTNYFDSTSGPISMYGILR